MKKIAIASLGLLLCASASYGVDYTVNGAAVPIPDNAYDGSLGSMAFVDLNVPDSVRMNDVDIILDIGHTWVGDLTIKLRSPAGTVVDLVSRAGGAEPDDGVTAFCCGNSADLLLGTAYEMDDAAPTSSETMGDLSDPVAPNAWYSSGFANEFGLSDLNGENSQGVWTVFVGDGAGGDLGTIDGFTLQITAATGQDRGTPSDKGSFLVYSKIEVRWENVPPFNLIQDTFVHLTNDYPGAVAVKMYFVNGDAPVFSAHWDGDPTEMFDSFTRTEEATTSNNQLEEAGGGGDTGARDHPGWNYLDNQINLTANEPAYWAASTGLPKGVSPWSVLDPGPPPGRPDPNNPAERHLRGYIVAFAVDAVSGEEIRWNHLAGDGTIVNYAREYSWQYGAYSFAVVDATVENGDPTGTPGHLDFDGAEYSNAPAELLMNFIASGSDAYSNGANDVLHETDLTVMPLNIDLRQETGGPVTTKVSFDIWNENEVKFTNLDRCVTCWDQEVLSNHAIPNHFLVGALHTDGGKARMNGLASFLCPDSVQAPILGVAAKIMEIGAMGTMAGGVNLTGLGREAGKFYYDDQGPPPESNWNPTGIFNP